MADKLTNLLQTIAHLKRDGECENCGEVYGPSVVMCPKPVGEGSRCGGVIFRMMPGDSVRVLDQVISGARLAKKDAEAEKERQSRLFARDWALEVLEGQLTREDQSGGMISVRTVKRHREWMLKYIRPALTKVVRE